MANHNFYNIVNASVEPLMVILSTINRVSKIEVCRHELSLEKLQEKELIVQRKNKDRKPVNPSFLYRMTCAKSKKINSRDWCCDKQDCILNTNSTSTILKNTWSKLPEDFRKVFKELYKTLKEERSRPQADYVFISEDPILRSTFNSQDWTLIDDYTTAPTNYLGDLSSHSNSPNIIATTNDLGGVSFSLDDPQAALNFSNIDLIQGDVSTNLNSPHPFINSSSYGNSNTIVTTGTSNNLSIGPGSAPFNPDDPQSVLSLQDSDLLIDPRHVSSNLNLQSVINLQNSSNIAANMQMYNNHSSYHSIDLDDFQTTFNLQNVDSTSHGSSFNTFIDASFNILQSSPNLQYNDSDLFPYINSPNTLPTHTNNNYGPDNAPTSLDGLQSVFDLQNIDWSPHSNS
ncbi:217_t:CDS:1 [Ambispora leptoticha]|uniref:217_t:CDS:1 n=1 Tax=Ambispora leptoticha TaxID=144679 RepID=A0A9N9FGV8_9GLOM|nr:217_t:CDS:1 [Ambispora leptoticha]